MQIEGPERIAIERRDEHDGRQPVGWKRLQHAKAIELGHLYVEKDDVWLERPDRRQRRASIGAFANDGDGAVGVEIAPDAAAGDRFVVDDEYLHGHGLWSVDRSGISSERRAPPPGPFVRSRR